MGSNPKVSVIVPIYNVEKYLRECLDSIQSQTYTDFECIMINDGSVDKSREIAESYLNDKRFILVNQSNSGQSVARNKGIKMSRGEFLCFVDSDDTVESDMYELLYCNAKKYEADVSMCRSNHIVSGNIIHKAWSGQVRTYMGKGEIIKFLFSQSGPSISVCVKFIRGTNFLFNFLSEKRQRMRLLFWT